MWMEKQLQTEMWSVITQTLTCAKQVYTRPKDTQESGAAGTRGWEGLESPLHAAVVVAG